MKQMLELYNELTSEIWASRQRGAMYTVLFFPQLFCHFMFLFFFSCSFLKDLNTFLSPLYVRGPCCPHLFLLNLSLPRLNLFEGKKYFFLFSQHLAHGRNAISIWINCDFYSVRLTKHSVTLHLFRCVYVCVYMYKFYIDLDWSWSRYFPNPCNS